MLNGMALYHLAIEQGEIYNRRILLHLVLGLEKVQIMVVVVGQGA